MAGRIKDESGQALLPGLGGAIALIAAALALVAISGALTGKGRLQRAADLTAISAARSMRDDFSSLLAPPLLPNGLVNPAHIDKAAYLSRARQAALAAAKSNGIDPGLLRLSFPDANSLAPVKARAEVRSRPNGFSMMTRRHPRPSSSRSWARSAWPRSCTISPKNVGGVAR